MFKNKPLLKIYRVDFFTEIHDGCIFIGIMSILTLSSPIYLFFSLDTSSKKTSVGLTMKDFFHRLNKKNRLFELPDEHN